MHEAAHLGIKNNDSGWKQSKQIPLGLRRIDHCSGCTEADHTLGNRLPTDGPQTHSPAVNSVMWTLTDHFNQAYISTHISTSRSKTAKWRTQRGNVLKLEEKQKESVTEDDRWMFKASGGRGRTLRQAVKDRRRVKWINKSRNGGRSTRQKTTAGEADWERAKSRSETEREPESLWRATREPRRCVQHVNTNAKSLKGFHPAASPAQLCCQVRTQQWD